MARKWGIEGSTSELSLAFRGLFLQLALYRKALIPFIGGEDRVISQVPVVRDGISLGHQRFMMASDDVAFRLTGYANQMNNHETHLSRLIRHSPLKGMHWINMYRHKLQLVTLSQG